MSHCFYSNSSTLKFTSAMCILHCMTHVFFNGNTLWHRIYLTFIPLVLYWNNMISVLYYEVCSPSPFWDNPFITFIKIKISYFNTLFLFTWRYRPVHKTGATLNANHFIDICSISSKFRMCMYYGIKNVYAQNQSSIHCSCVRKAVHNRTFWWTLVSWPSHL